MFRKIATREILSDLEVNQRHQQLRSDYTQLYIQFFDICAKRFSNDVSTREEFRQSVEIFLGELERKW